MGVLKPTLWQFQHGFDVNSLSQPSAKGEGFARLIQERSRQILEEEAGWKLSISNLQECLQEARLTVDPHHVNANISTVQRLSIRKEITNTYGHNPPASPSRPIYGQLPALLDLRTDVRAGNVKGPPRPGPRDEMPSTWKLRACHSI